MNCAIVGLGKIGIMHAAMVSNVPGARLAALIDREPKLGRHVRSMMGKPIPFFTSIEEAQRQVLLQAAFVCTPQFAHHPVAEVCLESGLDVFVEKPLAHCLEDAESLMVSLHRHPRAVAAVGFMKAHEGLYQEVGRLLQGGALGELAGFEATCYLSQVFKAKNGWIYARKLSGGGIVINSTCHLLHALERWFGRVRTLIARCRSVHSREVEDEASIELEFAGVSGMLHTSWSQPGYEVETSTIRIHGSAGTLEVDDGGFRLELRQPWHGSDARESEYGQGVHTRLRGDFERTAFNLSPSYGGEGYYREDLDFVSACRERRPALVGWEEGLAVQRVIDAIYRSHGQRIELQPDRASGLREPRPALFVPSAQAN
jgi:UDP-N-acetyl-2-amino-2-deoxyglucuronate dehydrogenase